MKKSIIVVLTVALLSISFIPCAKASLHEFQWWIPMYLRYNFSDKFIGRLEVNPRLTDNVTDVGTFRFRPSLGYRLNDKVILWGGYAWAPNFFGGFRNENRIWEEIEVNNTWNKLKIANLFRLEQRFIENAADMGLRGRYTLQFMYPLDSAELWSLVLSNKFYLNFYTQSNGPDFGVDQNRLFAGVNRKINNRLNLEAGYQLQQLFKNGRASQRFNHGLLTNIYWNLN